MSEIDLVVEDPDTIPQRLEYLKKLQDLRLGQLRIARLFRNDEDVKILERGLARRRDSISRLERGLALRDGPIAGTA